MGTYALVDGSGSVTNVILYDGTAPFTAPAGLSLVNAGTTKVAIGWTYDTAGFVAPPVAPLVAVPASRVLSSADFLALFTPAQTAALWSADPTLMTGALKVITQGTANLDSADAANLLTLAVSKGVLTDADRTRILAGTPPPAVGTPPPAS